ncbi:LamG-like jellyroll fold domain-containing protein [Streptomyces chromofuscus]|uniref:LamG-like jellyroll fold domain-containing protein n=2 Tax=Streptomyces chromofuscus TaxID=42881 RepID=UPI001D150190|nr:LamG-like jellyroll fold domain-containing protein [Streptomyces chromofuscus]
MDEAAALAQAKASGQQVEVTTARSEFTTTHANPDGTLTLTQSTTPQRVRQDDGTWGVIDTTLERRPDGRVAPKGAVVDVSFSGGGSGADMLRLGRDGRSVTLGWTDTLPQPVLDGATATYPEVFDGVDLQLTATAEGYREVLVVKTPEAAHNPALEHLVITADGDGLSLVPGAGGGLRALDEDGNAIFRGPAGLMWDSAGDSSSGPQTQLQPAAATSDAAALDDSGDPVQPGEGDASAVLPVTVAESSIAVRPDLELLRGAETVYPVFIDPPMGLGAQERTKISSDGDRFWMFDGDKGVGKCGTADGYTCGGGYIDRMYFEFAPTALAGKHVLDATFRARETWSFNCTPYTVDLKRTNNISEATGWPGPAQLDHLGDRAVSAGRGDLCSPDQPDAWIEFNDNTTETDENLTSTVRSFANGSFSRLTLMLRAHDETEPRAWKRFDDNAELQVIYAYKPGVPTNVGIISGINGTTAYCKTSSTDPLIVTLGVPTVQARLQTLVGSTSGALLRAEFIVERGDDAPWRRVWSGSSPSTGWHADNDLERMETAKLVDGGLYRLKARTRSHWTFNTVPDDLWSPYNSSWCYFKLDSAAPKEPTITSLSPYTQCSADVCEGKGGPGVPGSFTFEPNTADIKDGKTDVTAYEWNLLYTKPKQASSNGALKTTVSDVVPPLAGTTVLSVRAKDVYNRWGPYKEFTFKVAPAQGVVGRWHLNGDGTDTPDTGTPHTATPGGTRIEWPDKARRGEGDKSLGLNGGTTDPAQQTSYAATATPVFNTQESFTVSTWVQLNDASTNRVVLSAPGTNGSAFALYYSSALKKWVFNRTDKDVASPVHIRSVADTDKPPLNVWTHLAGVFKTEGADNLPDTDPSNDTIQLFINGRPQGQPVVLSQAAPTYTPWTATGGLQFGRFKAAGTYSSYHVGLLDEVAAWQRALSAPELAHETRVLENEVPANELVAHWNATTSQGTQISSRTPYPVPAMTVSGTTIGEEDDALLVDGAAHAAATGPVVDETGSFTVSADVRLNTDQLASKPLGYRAQVAGQTMGGESSWALSVVKRENDLGQHIYLWEFARTAVGPDGTVTQSTVVPATDEAQVGTRVTLTGVFNAQADPDTGDGDLDLYVGEEAQPREVGTFTTPQQGSGELSWGRGTAAGSTAHYFTGALEQLRVWTGAMTIDQIGSQVLAPGITG